MSTVGTSMVGIARWWTLFRVQVASRGWPVVERAVGVVADEWLRGFVSSMEGAAMTRRAVKMPSVSRETTGVLRVRDVSRETISGAVKMEVRMMALVASVLCL